MSKTPLLRSLRRLFQEYRAAEASGLSVPALREVRAEAAERAAKRGPGVRRRDLLLGAGAGALTLALPRRASAGPQPTIAVVGGGIAGLACALWLDDKGIDATVYEASGRVGGRMFTNTSSYFGGQVAEWGGELIDTGHKTVRKLAKRFDLPLDDMLAAQPAGSEDTYKFFGSYYSKAQADIDFEPVFEAVSADEAAAPFPTLFDDHTAAGAALDGLSVHDWIETRVPGGHGSPLGRLLDAAYAIEYGADTTEQAALNLIYLLAFQPDPGSFAAFGESDERFHIRGGNQQLPEAIAQHLGIGTRVKLDHSLKKIKETPSGRYELTFKKGSSTVVKTVDYVVLALPFAVLREIDHDQAGFDELKGLAIQELGRGHNGKTQVQIAQRIWNQPGPWPGVSNGSTYSDTGYQASWEVTRGQPGTAGILVAYSGGSVTDALTASTPFATASNAGVQQDACQALSRLEPVFPGVSALWTEKAMQSIAHKSALFRASYSYYRVGQYTTFAGYEGARQGGVLFAGEHTSTDYQGFMEGGASEGVRAAKELFKLL